jgi:DNA-binding NtrC family response regulator
MSAPVRANGITAIRQALERARSKKSKAAGLLGLTRYTLLYRMRKYASARQSARERGLWRADHMAAQRAGRIAP